MLYIFKYLIVLREREINCALLAQQKAMKLIEQSIKYYTLHVDTNTDEVADNK